MFPQLKSLKLACHPAIITLKAPQRRCALLMGALQRAAVSSRASFVAKLTSDPSYLRDVLLMWVHKGTEAQAAATWASLVDALRRGNKKA